MGVTRTHLAFEEQFTRIPNGWARDERLTRKARGLLVEIMSHRVGWHVTIRALAKTGREGRDAIDSAVRELLEHGYVRRVQGRAADGKFSEIEYELCDPSTVAGFPGRGSTGHGSPVHGKSGHKEDHPSEDQQLEDHQVVLLSADADATPDLIDYLWTLWPSSRRSTRKVVAKKVATALKAASGEVILAAARRHAEVWASWPKADEHFVPLLSTWLHQERWTGADPQPRAGRVGAVEAGREADALLRAKYGDAPRAVSA